MDSKPIVLSMGEILWDMLPTGKRAGGAPTNFVYHATMNGADGYAISAIGNDSLGEELSTEVRRHNISSILQHNEYPTGTVGVNLNDGIPEYNITEEVAWDHLRPNHELSDLVATADAVCFGTLGMRAQESRDTILNLLKDTKNGAIKYFDINIRQKFYTAELITELLETATVFKLNDEELELLRTLFPLPATEDDACRWFLSTYSLDYVILTAGSSYSTIYSHTESSTIATPHVQVADTVGAGDSFSGTFTIKILQGANLREAHKAAVNTAAYVCTQEGAWPAYPVAMPDYVAGAADTTDAIGAAEE